MGLVGPGGLRMDLDRHGIARLAAALDEARPRARRRGPLDHPLGGRDGTLPRHRRDAVDAGPALGATGVAAKASGLDDDLRRDAPYGAYAELEVGAAVSATGDVAARFHVRAQEAHETIASSRRRSATPARARYARAARGGAGLGATAVGGRRGPARRLLRSGCVPARTAPSTGCHLRSASFANWPVVAAAVPGDLVPDFPLINKSFELCYACTDR